MLSRLRRAFSRVLPNLRRASSSRRGSVAKMGRRLLGFKVAIERHWIVVLLVAVGGAVSWLAGLVGGAYDVANKVLCFEDSPPCLERRLTRHRPAYDAAYALDVAGDFTGAYAIYGDIVDGPVRARHPIAAARLALGYRWGDGVVADSQRAQDYARRAQNYGLTELAESGNPSALYTLGLFHQEGLNVMADPRRSETLLRRASDRGEMFADVELARFYAERGRFEEAIDWVRPAALSGFGPAAEYFGSLLEDRIPFDRQDIEDLHNGLTLAARLGHIRSAAKLGHLYWRGMIRAPGRDQAWHIERMKQLFERAAEAGNADGQWGLGLVLRYQSEPGQPDYGRALDLFHRAAEQGHGSAADDLGVSYFHGRGVPQSLAEAARWFTRGAELGDAGAQHNLGQLLDSGIGVDADPARAREWLHRAALQGHADAQNRLGVLHRNGRGGTQSDSQAVYWYRRAAAQGHIWAQDNLGWMLQGGLGVEANEREAAAWYFRAALGGGLNAMNNLGRLFQNARTMPTNDEEAVAWYRRAAEQGYAPAQFNLGWMYSHGRGVAEDEAQAAAWLTRAALQGNSDAQNDLGVLYASATTLPQNQAMAAFWYRRAAEQGHALAQSNLGYMYLLGDGTSVSDERALHWFRASAGQGNANAQTALGRLFRYGLPTIGADLREAALWYRRAAEQGHREAQTQLAWIVRDGLGGLVPDRVEARRLLEAAALQGYADAETSLGWMHEEGQGGVEPDIARAFELYQRAASRGSAWAQYNVGRILYFPNFGRRDTAAAISAARASREGGNACGAYLLAEIFLDGQEGGDITPAEALSALEYAAEWNHSCALNTLGNLYELGYLVESDIQRASHYYHLAAQNGSVKGATNFYRLGRTHALISDSNREAYVAALEQAAGQGDVVAVCMLVNELTDDAETRDVARAGNLLMTFRERLSMTREEQNSILNGVYRAAFADVGALRPDVQRGLAPQMAERGASLSNSGIGAETAQAE